MNDRIRKADDWAKQHRDVREQRRSEILSVDPRQFPSALKVNDLMNAQEFPMGAKRLNDPFTSAEDENAG